MRQMLLQEVEESSGFRVGLLSQCVQKNAIIPSIELWADEIWQPRECGSLRVWWWGGVGCSGGTTQVSSKASGAPNTTRTT